MRFLLFEEIIEDETKKAKIMAEGIKFRTGKIACSFNLSVPSVFVFDNLDQFTSLYCNEKIKIHILPEEGKKE